MNKTIAIFALAAVAASAILPATASTFTVGGSGNNFTITRHGDTSAAETVHYRTVPLSAFPGQHYTEKGGTLVFAPGQTGTNITVSAASMSNDAYRFQTDASRAYRFELLDEGGFPITNATRDVSTGLRQFKADKVSKSVTNLVTLSGGSFSSGMASSKYLDVSYTPPSGDVQGSGKTLEGYVLIDDSYDYAQKPATVSTATLIDSTGAPASYLNSLGYKIYATVCFTEKEKDDGYQYIQIVAGTANTGYDTGADPNGAVKDPTNSVYKVCFELADGSHAEGKAYFPHRGTTSSEFSNSAGKLHQQKYKSGYGGSGAVVLPVTTGSITTRFDAGGDNDDTWGYKDFFVRMALCDTTRPTKLADPVVAPGPYRYGTTFYVSIPFREIVTVTGTPTLHTDWGDLSYFFGSGSNVLTFKGVIDADYGENLVVRTLSGTVTDLAGNELATPLSVYKEFSCTVDYPWAGSGTEAYPYVITTTNQLGYLAARVNAAYGDDFAGKYFVLAADLDYGGTSDWDGYPDNTSGNNFTPVGCFGRSFKGHFDGQGHTVSGIRLDKQGADEDERSSVGLFGFVSGGSVRNIVLRDSKFQGERNVGGIVGYLSGGTVTNCTLYHVLAGTKCVGRSSSAGAGIVVGHDDGTVSDCHYRDCRVGTTYREEIELPGSAGSAAFPRVHNDRVDNVFAVAADAGVAVTPATVDGVVIDGASYYAAGSTFDLSYSGAVPANWSVVYAPTGGAAVNGDTLVLAAADATVTASVAPPAAYAAHWQAGADHDGTGDKPYVITTPEGLQMLSAEVNAGTGFSGTYFRLGADIDMSAVANFMPIGQNALNKRFAGNFDGDGQTISGLSVNTNGNHVGLFGYVTGSVANLTLCGATITGEDYVGGIVGVLYSSDARLTGCRVVGSVVTATLATDKVPQTGAIVGGGVIVSSATGNTYHSTIVRAPNATGGDFHADGDAFNVGVGSYYAPLPRYGDIGPSGATLDPSCLLLPTNAPAVRAALIAAYADPAAHTAHGGAAPDLSGLVVTSGVTRLYAVTNCAPAGLSVSGTDVVLAGLGRSYFAPGDAVSLVPPAGFAIVAASYTDASGAHDITPAPAFAYSFPMPASDVAVATTLATSGFCGRADANGGENVVWSFDPATGALAVSTNAAAVGTDFAMADYTWSGSANTPWAALRPYIRSISIAPGVASVGDYAFWGCTALESVSIGGDVSGIGESAFQDCTALEAVAIPGSVASIGHYAFMGCTALVTVEGGANVTRIGARAFGNLSGSNGYTTPWLSAQPAGVVYFGKVAIAFQKNGADTAVEIADGTVSIAECAFNSSPVTSIVLPESVAHIGKQAFGMCDYLAAVYLLSAAPPALDDPDYLFTVEGDEQSNPDLRFYVRGAAYAEAWSGVWNWMANRSNWTDANRIVIGAVSCAEGITVAGTPAVTYGGTNYYATGTTIALGGVPPAPDPVPAGYTDQLAGYAVNGRPVDGDSFAMPERDATVTPRWTVIDFETGHAGTEQDPYVIYNKDQLDLLSARVRDGNGYTNAYFRLGADIAYDPTALDENGENYTAIGDYNHEFLGNFDGDGHTVRGIRINKTGDSDADEYQGLFGCVRDGTIRNVTLADSVVIGYRYVGGVVGYQYFGDAIANCRVESDVILGAGCDGADFCGGIVGYTFASVRVRGCLSAATVTDRGKSGCDYYGGIVGWCSSPNDDVQDCLVLGGTVAACGKLGAIAGKKNNEGSFTNNYYAACTVNGTTNATNVGCGDPAGDIDGARYAHTITLGPGVRIVGEETVYSVSCLTAIGTSALRYTGGGTNVIYGGAGETVTLVYDGVPPEGYAFVGFVLNGVAVDGDSFEMPDADATVEAEIITEWEALNRRLAEGGDITLAKDYAATAEDTYLTVPAGVAVTLDLSGHILDRNLAAATNLGFVIEVRGSLVVTDGAPAATHAGALAGIAGGVITGGNNSGYGGGVYNQGTFTLISGTISQNIACNGGGVYVEGGTFTMDDGSISGNTVVGNGGGVYVEGGTFTMNDGAITNNTANSNGGGVYVTDTATFQISGSPVVTGNTKGADGPADNVYLYSGKIITVANALTENANIGVTMRSPGVFTSGLSGRGSAANFFSDDDASGVYMTGGEAAVGTLYSVEIASGITGGTVAAPERAPAGGSVTITVTPEAGYVLTSLTVTDENDQPVAVDENNRFTMPDSDVTVTADFLPPMTWASLNEALQSSGTVILHNDVTAEATDGFLTVPKSVSVTLDLNGHILDRALTEATANGFVIRVNGGLTVTDSDPTAAHSGTEVTGGVITGGYNSSSGSGGGVDVYSGTFTMTGGTITGNHSYSGSGVYVDGVFNMSGGSITDNSADYSSGSSGGGVYVSGKFNLSGGSITGNSANSNGGGVYLTSRASFRISGSPVVTGNTKGADGPADNVYLYSGKIISVAGTLTEAARIGVTMAVPGVFTSGLSGCGSAANFTSDSAGYAVGISAIGEAGLALVGNDTAQLAVVWIDGDNADGLRADSLTINYQNSGLTMAATVRADENGLWNATIFGNVALADLTVDWDQIDTTIPRIGDDASGYTYGELLPGYRCKVEGSTQAGFTITMMHEPQKTFTAAGVVAWDDDNDINQVRPDSVTIHLWKNGEEIGSTTATAAVGWQYSFGEFAECTAVDEDGVVVSYQRDVYTIKQDMVSHYLAVYGGFNITNRYVGAPPAYLDGADDDIVANYYIWAAKYGPDTASAYESCFLLGVDPAAVPTALGGSSSISPTGSLLRVVQFNATAKGFHLELASDYAPLFQPLDPDGDPDQTLLGNGFAAIELATDPAVFASTQTLKPSNPQTLPQLVTMPVPVSIDAATGRATVDFDIDSFLKLLVDSGEIPPEALGFITAKMPSPLFIRPAITTIYPDDYTDFIYLLVAEP